MKLLIETYSEQKKTLPELNDLRKNRGQIRVRFPKSLHEQLAVRADKKVVSHNIRMIELLSEGLSAFKRKEAYEKALQEFTQTYRIAGIKGEYVLKCYHTDPFN